MRLPRLLLLTAVLTAAGATVAFAATLPTTGSRVGAASSALAGCDPDGVSVSYTNSYVTAVADYQVTAVTVSGIAAGCTGAPISVTVRNAANGALWQGRTTVTGASATLPVTPFHSSSVAGWAVTVGS